MNHDANFKPFVRPAVLPSRRAVAIDGRIRKPADALDLVMFGVCSGQPVEDPIFSRQDRFNIAQDQLKRRIL